MNLKFYCLVTLVTVMILFKTTFQGRRNSIISGEAPKKNCGLVIFYTEILTGKVVLWCFFTSETSEKST